MSFHQVSVETPFAVAFLGSLSAFAPHDLVFFLGFVIVSPSERSGFLKQSKMKFFTGFL